MTNCIQDRAQIIVGSKATFTTYLVDEAERPISLTPYASGNIVFCNCAGVRTVIPLTVPGANPDKGELNIVITAVNTALGDKKWKDADLELIDGSSEMTVIPLNDKFEIIARNCPPVI